MLFSISQSFRSLAPIIAPLFLTVSGCQTSRPKSVSSKVVPAEKPAKPELLTDLLGDFDTDEGDDSRDKALWVGVSTPAISQIYPHLQKFGGNLVLANRRLQLVFSGRGHKLQKSGLQPLILAAFVYENDAWVESKALGRVFVRAQEFSNNLLFHSLDVEQNANAAIVQISFGPSQSSPPVAAVAFSLRKDHRMVTAGFIETKAMGGIKRQTSIDLFTESPAEVGDADKLFDHSATSSSPFVWGQWTAFGSSAAALGSPVSQRETPDSINLLRWTLKTSPMIIFFGREEAALSSVMRPVAKNCLRYSITSPTDLTKWSTANAETERCFLDQTNQRTVLVEIESASDSEQSGTSVQSRRLALTHTDVAGRFATIEILPEESLRVRVPAGKDLFLADFEQPILPDPIAAQDLADAGGSYFPEDRHWGELEIQPLSQDEKQGVSGPSILKIRRVDAQNAATEFQFEDLQRIGFNTFSVDSWPINVELPQGQYIVEIINGENFASCSTQIGIMEDESSLCFCRMVQQGFRPKNRRSVAFAQAQPDLDPTELAASLGVNDLAVTVSDLDLEDNDFDSKTMLNVSVTSKNADVSISAWPLTPKINRTWHEYINRNSDQDRLLAFSSFIKKFAPKALIVLECPSLAIALPQYIDYLQKVRPDQVRIFNCPTFEHQPESIASIMTNLARMNRPPALLPANNSEDRMPLMKMSNILIDSTVPRTESALVEALKSGTYSIQASGYIGAPEKQRSDIPRFHTRRGATNFVTSAEITYALSPHLKEQYIDVWSEHGRASTIKLPEITTDNSTRSMFVSFETAERPKWVRMELRGRQESGTGSFSNRLAAATNFSRVE
jgi:hypothetical protein